MPIKQKKNPTSHLYRKLTAHAKKQCELHDEQCELYYKQYDISICNCYLSSSQHLGHNTFGIIEAFESKTGNGNIQRDLQEIERSLYPKYQDIISSIKVQYDLETKS